jgi:hypothetical protein
VTGDKGKGRISEEGAGSLGARKREGRGPVAGERVKRRRKGGRGGGEGHQVCVRERKREKTAARSTREAKQSRHMRGIACGI